MIWNDFKDFYRRLCLKLHFHKDNGNFDRLTIEETELIEFMAWNLEESVNLYNSIHNKFVDKSNWKTPGIHKSLEVFQRAFKNGLLKSKIKNNKKKNLSKQEFAGLKELTDNPDIVIKKAKDLL